MQKRDLVSVFFFLKRRLENIGNYKLQELSKYGKINKLKAYPLGFMYVMSIPPKG